MKIPVISPLLVTALRILSLAVFVVTIVAAYGGHVNPNIFALPSILTLALPWLAGATLLLTLMWVLWRKFFFAVLGVLTIVACLSPLSQAFPIGNTRTASEGSVEFSLMTYNVMHTVDVRQPEDVPQTQNRTLRFIIGQGADIVCLQELEQWKASEVPGFTPALRDSLYKAYPWRIGVQAPNHDLKILSKYPAHMIAEGAFDTHGRPRLLLGQIDIKGRPLKVITVHLDSYNLSDEERDVVTDIKSVGAAKESLNEFKGVIRTKLSDSFRVRALTAKTLRQWVDTIQGPLIVCGDFNDVPESWAYRTVRGDDLRDAYAETSLGPTWTYNQHLFLFHIDQILYRGPLEALRTKRFTFNGSDHYPVEAWFALEN